MDYNLFRDQILAMRRMGPIPDLLGRVSGLAPIASAGEDFNLDREARRIVGIIDSMTPEERTFPVLTTRSARCLRIADGAGVETGQVHALHKQFCAMEALMRQVLPGS